MTCISNPNSCISCVSGFSLRGTSCISTFYFGVTIKFNVNPSTFLNNYYNFLLQTANSVNQNINSILVNSIVYGSATVDLSVTTTAAQGSSAASTQQSSLTTLASSQSIASMPVLTGSVTATTT